MLPVPRPLLKIIFKQATPPFLWSFAKLTVLELGLRKQPKNNEELLFSGDAELFVESVEQARVYGEYGLGQSTLWVFENTKSIIHAVDTSCEWVKKTQATIRKSDRVQLDWIDVGQIGDWGMPQNFLRRSGFRNYVSALWRDESIRPDVVLIDGRFRIACWFETMINAAPGTHIIFDDYTSRPLFHFVEEFQSPESKNARQARFIVPEDLDREALIRERDAFLMCRE